MFRHCVCVWLACNTDMDCSTTHETVSTYKAIDSCIIVHRHNIWLTVPKGLANPNPHVSPLSSKVMRCVHKAYTANVYT